MAGSYHEAPESLGTAPPGCPAHATWSPLSTDYLTDPYPIANELRDEHSVFWSEQLGHLVVTDMDLIEEVFMTPDVYASSNVQDPIAPVSYTHLTLPTNSGV